VSVVTDGPSPGAGLEEAVFAANAAYLRQLAHAASQSSCVADEFPQSVRGQFAALDDSACHRLSAMPFTLFSLRFADAKYWFSAMGAAQRHEPRDGNSTSLARTAVFLAWHLVRSEPTLVGMTLGMTADVAALYRSLPLSDVDRLAGHTQAALLPRWPTRVAFWGALLAGTDSRYALERARFYGLQLLAAECLTDLPSRTRARSVRSK
jgi:hypothetical protein